MFRLPWQAEGFQTYIHNEEPLEWSFVRFLNETWACMMSVYVLFSMTGRGSSNIHTCSNAPWIRFLNDFWRLLRVHVWTCMFHFPWQAEAFQTYIHGQTALWYSYFSNTKLILRLYVCMFETYIHIRVRASNIHTYIHTNFKLVALI